MRPNLLLATIAIVALAFVGCGGDDDGGTTGPTAPATDLTGTWSISEQVDASDCGDGTYSENYTVTVTQDGNELTVVVPGTGTFTGSISGTRVRWTGTYDDGDGTTTIDSMNLTVDGSGDALSGSTNWTYREPGFTCSGTTQVTGTRD